MNKMTVDFVKVSEQRYESLDDYYKEGDTDVFKITDTGNPTYNKILLIHALSEQLTTEYNGVKEEDIAKFDLSHENSEQPGDELNAPYRDNHLLSTALEEVILAFCKIPIKTYNAALKAALEKVDNG